ncbi:MAG: OmpA family protein, partial [Dongiaceae bacterium]
AAAETAMATALIEGQVRIAFEPGSDAIPETALGEINGLIRKMSDDPFMRVQVLAYAAGDDETTSVARRISLGRAMEVRRYLSEQGIDFDRMDVRALGNTAFEEPIDRVDIIPLPQ